MMKDQTVSLFTCAPSGVTINPSSLVDRIKETAITRSMLDYFAEDYREKSPSEYISLSFKNVADIQHYIEDSARNVHSAGENLLGYATGKNIDMAKVALNTLSSDMEKMSRSFELFLSPDSKIDNFLNNGFRADDPVIMSTYDGVISGFREIKAKTDDLVKFTKDYISARDFITEDLCMCYEPFSMLKDESKTRASSAYRDLKLMQADYDLDNQIETNTLTALEDSCDSEMKFAQEVAKDKSVEEQELKDYLFLKALQILEFEEDKLQWMEEKWRNRTDNIHEFINLCMRFCNSKIRSWTKSIALVYYYLVERSVIKDTPAKRRYYILYMQNEFPRSENQDIRSIANHFKVTVEEKEEHFHTFDDCFTIAMNPSIPAIAS